MWTSTTADVTDDLVCFIIGSSLFAVQYKSERCSLSFSQKLFQALLAICALSPALWVTCSALSLSCLVQRLPSCLHATATGRTAMEEPATPHAVRSLSESWRTPPAPWALHLSWLGRRQLSPRRSSCPSRDTLNMPDPAQLHKPTRPSLRHYRRIARVPDQTM
jgi:hypothetical protein